MVYTDNDNQRKRRLPQWILGVAAADKIRKAGSSSQRGLEIDKLEFHTGLHKKKSRQKCEEVAESVQELEHTINAKKNNRSNHNVEKGKEIDSFSLSDRSEEDAEPTFRRFEEDLSFEEDLEVTKDTQVRCKTRKRKSGGVTKVTMDKKRAKNNGLLGGRTSQKQTIRKKQTTESSEEIEGSSPGEGSEDEVDLTVDDLMNIAQEYVRADKEKERKTALLEELQPNSTLTNTSNTSTYESSSSIQATRSISGVSTCRMRESTSSNITEKRKETATGKSIPVNVNRTGDPKADMLALFLGPSWNKSSADEKNLDKFSDSLTFSQELEKPIESQVMAGGEMPPLVVKKKSSLKDKVAMFL